MILALQPGMLPRRLSRALGCGCLLVATALAGAQGVQQPANTPLDQQTEPPVKAQQPSTQPSAKPGDQTRSSSAAQQGSETPSGKPVPQANSVPDQLPVPTAVPSMMPKEPGTEFDRMVALVNGQVVLDSDVNEEARFESIQPAGTASAEAGSSPRDQEIERLVDRDLILQQAKLVQEQSVSDADVTKQVDQLRRTIPECKNFDCTTDAGWSRFLASHGFTPEEFQALWKDRMQVLAFIDERFGGGISVTPAQIRAFYQNTMLPQYAKAHVKPAPLASVEDRIRNVLEQQQISSLLRDWLQSLRAQGSVTILHPGEEAP